MECCRDKPAPPPISGFAVIERRSKLRRSRSFNFDRKSSRFSIALSAPSAQKRRTPAGRTAGIRRCAGGGSGEGDSPLQGGLAKPCVVCRAGTIGVTPRTAGPSHGGPSHGNGAQAGPGGGPSQQPGRAARACMPTGNQLGIFPSLDLLAALATLCSFEPRRLPGAGAFRFTSRAFRGWFLMTMWIKAAARHRPRSCFPLRWFQVKNDASAPQQ